MKKRVFSLVLFLAILLTSCGSDGGQTNDTTLSDTTIASVEESSPFVKDELPANLDLNNETIRFCVQSNCIEEYFIAEATGDIVDDAIYNANLNVENRLNVNIEYIPYTYTSWNDRSLYMTAVENSILADDDSFDVLISTGFISGFMVRGYLMNLADKPYLDFDKPWWSSDMAEQMTINGVLPFITGDISIGKTKGIMCMFFNKNIHSDYKMDDLYTLVDDGKWTVDKMGELAAMAYSDLNGNSKADEDDRLGLVFEGYNCYLGFLDSCRLTVIETAGDEFSFVFGNERNTNIIQKLVEILSSSDGISSHGEDDSAKYLAEDALFKNGNVLFTGGWINCAASYRNLDFEYGILPYPKFDESQENYGSTVLNIYSSYALPVTNKRVDSTCAVLEALSSEFYHSVTPAYFETTLKVKYSQDNEMSRMFDMLRDTASFNIALTYANALDYIADNIKNALGSKDPNWASRMASRKTTVETLIGNISDAYAEMANK